MHAEEEKWTYVIKKDLLEVETFPSIRFYSTSAREIKKGLVIEGLLHLHGVSKNLSLVFRVIEPKVDASGGVRLGMESQFEILPEDFNLFASEKAKDLRRLYPGGIRVFFSFEGLELMPI